MNASPARILIFAGHDPCGGAGIQADIEATLAAGAFPLTIITARTAQNTAGVAALNPADSDMLEREFLTLKQDFDFDACKIGLLPTAEIAALVADLCSTLKPLPMVLDPVMRAGAGQRLAAPDVASVVSSQLLPLVRVVTPNVGEAFALTGADDVETAGQRLCEAGAGYVLITDGDGASSGAPHPTLSPQAGRGDGEGEAEAGTIQNRLFHHGRLRREYTWPRLPGSFHGSGCTLASSIAARLGQGLSPEEAIEQAQRYTFETLRRALTIGRAQRHPNRLLWQSE